jgi:flagellar biosynthesis/type III secretory pathway M-ring protein FliF/YscJ
LSTTGESVTKTEVRFSHKDETQLVPSGTEVKDMTAAISVPRSFFRSVYRRDNHDDKIDPTDEQLQPVVDRYLKKIQLSARQAIGAKTDDQVRVDWFDDTLQLAMTPPAPVSAGLFAGGSVGTVMGQYAKQAILGALAGGALLMMLMMVRKSAPSLAGADADTNVFLGSGSGGGGTSNSAGRVGGKKRKGSDPGALDVGEDVFGEAGAGEAVLTGIELDDETLQSRKMVDEVSTMIKENPENAASLVKRWIVKGK